ncbi:MAG: hypothetical protein RR218_05140 [Gordonibacter sp.]
MACRWAQLVGAAGGCGWQVRLVGEAGGRSWWAKLVGEAGGHSWWVQLAGEAGGHSWWAQLVGAAADGAGDGRFGVDKNSVRGLAQRMASVYGVLRPGLLYARS